MCKHFTNCSRILLIFQTALLLKNWDCNGAKVCKYCKAWKCCQTHTFLRNFVLIGIKPQVWKSCGFLHGKSQLRFQNRTVKFTVRNGSANSACQQNWLRVIVNSWCFMVPLLLIIAQYQKFHSNIIAEIFKIQNECFQWFRMRTFQGLLKFNLSFLRELPLLFVKSYWSHVIIEQHVIVRLESR